MSRILAKIGLLLFCIILVVAAFLRGNYLGGLSVGIVYAIFAFLVSSVIYDMESSPKRKAIWEGCILAVLLVPVVYVFVFRLKQDPVVVELNERSNKVSSIIASDVRFSGLSVSTIKTKTINVRISGSVESRNDLAQFRSRIQKEIEPPFILVWDVSNRNTGETYEGSDSEVFEEESTVATTKD